MQLKLESRELIIEFSLFGASITKIYSKKLDRNLVYGYNNLNKYSDNHMFLGTNIGRSSGRVNNASLVIDNKNYDIGKNFLDKHSLHGGDGIHNKKFDLLNLLDDKIVFGLRINHLEDLFPANLALTITYTLNDNILALDYKGIVDRPSYLNLTNHVYFNFNEDKNQKILNHKLKINTNKYIKLDHDFIPKEISEVDKNFDFREFKEIRRDLDLKNPQLSLTGGYDHPYVFDNDDHEMIHMASVETSDVLMNLYSDNNAVVFYAGNSMDEPQVGLCLEAQGVPNNQEFDKYKNDNLIDKDVDYEKSIVWEFII